MPKTRVDTWQEKFNRNVERDAATAAALANLGWRVEIVWECETKRRADLQQRLQLIFNGLSGGG